MKNALILAAMAVVATGCATARGPVAGMTDQALTSFECEGRGFSGRMADDNNSIRLRTHEGSVNLAAMDDGSYEGDGWKLTTSGADGLTLMHKGKATGTKCKKA